MTTVEGWQKATSKVFKQPNFFL